MGVFRTISSAKNTIWEILKHIRRGNVNNPNYPYGLFLFKTRVQVTIDSSNNNKYITLLRLPPSAILFRAYARAISGFSGSQSLAIGITEDNNNTALQEVGGNVNNNDVQVFTYPNPFVSAGKNLSIKINANGTYTVDVQIELWNGTVFDLGTQTQFVAFNS